MPVDLHYHSTGTGDPLIILHGLFGSLENWATVARALSPGRQIVRVDARNHGRSPHCEGMSYAHMVADVVLLMEKLGYPSADLLGHSMGGKTAMELALYFPDRVRRLAVIDIAPRAYPPRHVSILNALNGIDPGQFSSRSEMESALLVTIPDREVVRFLLKGLEPDGHGRFRWRMGLAEISRAYPDINREIQSGRTFGGPALLVRGGDSDYVTEQNFESFRRLFPRARLNTIATAGHWVHAEQPQRLAATLESFFSRGREIT